MKSMKDRQLPTQLGDQDDRTRPPSVSFTSSSFQNLRSNLTPERAAFWCDTLRSFAVNPSLGDDDCRILSGSCLFLMRSLQDEVCVQRAGLLAVAVLCEKRNLAEHVGREGVIPLLTDAWKRFALDGILVKDAIVTMRSLSDVEHNKELFCSLGGIELLSKSMGDFFQNLSIQAASTALLANLCFESDARKREAVQFGTVEIIIKILQEFLNRGCLRLLSNACLALRNISFEESGLTRILLDEKNLNTILNMVSWSRNHPSVGHEGLRLVLNLSTNLGSGDLMTSNAKRIAEEIISYLQQTGESSSKQDFNHELCFAIVRSVIILHARILDHYHRDSFFLVAIAYGGKHVSNFSPTSTSIVADICFCIRAVLKDSGNREHFATIPGGIEMLIHAVSCLSEKPLQVEHALMALGNAVFDNHKSKEQVQEHGGIQAVQRILSEKYYLENVVEACLMAVHAICSMSTHNGDIASQNMMHAACVKAMRSLSGNAIIQERGLAAIVSLGSSQHAINGLRESSVCEVAEAALNAFPYSKVIRAQEMKIRSIIRGEPAIVRKERGSLQARAQRRFWRHFSR